MLAIKLDFRHDIRCVYKFVKDLLCLKKNVRYAWSTIPQ